MRDVIRTLECIKRNYNNDDPGRGCTIPTCVSQLTGSMSVDFDEVISDLRNERSRASTSQVTGQGSSQTLDYEANTPRTTIPSPRSNSVTTRPVRKTISGPTRFPTNVSRGASTPAGDSVRTEAARCVAIESHPKELQWVYVDAEKYGLREGCNGRWKKQRFTVSNWGSWGMSSSDVPVNATVVNRKGNPSGTGEFLKIENNDRFPVYYSVDAPNIGQKLDPRQEIIVFKPIYRAKNDYRSRTMELFVMWWDSTAVRTKR